MSDLLKRIADYFTNCYQGDDKTAPTMDITVTDLRYIANMNVERCRAEAELRNLKYNKRKDDVCEWKFEETNGIVWHCDEKCTTYNQVYIKDLKITLEDFECKCPYCRKKIKVVE